MDQARKTRLKVGPFIPKNSDGCTLLSWPYKKLPGRELPFRQCCIDHDESYWYGGTKQQRLAADTHLRDCVYAYGKTGIGKVGYFILSRGMFIAVRIFGSPKLPLPFRWKLGDPYVAQMMLGGYEKE